MFVKMFLCGTKLDQFKALDVILTIAPGTSNKKPYLRAHGTSLVEVSIYVH